MKDPFERTKVVVRHLPPAITQDVLMEQIDARFAGRYKWACFRPGKNSQKNQRHSRLYIDFNRPEDLMEFAEFFDGHVFVNEKGTQFKSVVEYAPSQRVPKSWSKKDGREGSISKDPEYLEFLELLAKPVENLPSAEIQLEKKEAERAGGIKEAPVVTPLMLFVRQKRAAKRDPQRGLNNVKLNRRTGGSISSAGPSLSPSNSKRGADRRRTPTSMYVLRGSSKNMSRKDKPVILASRQDQKQFLDNSGVVASGNGKEGMNNETEMITGGSGTGDFHNTRVVLLKGKEHGVSMASAVTLQSQSASTSPMRSSSKHLPRHGTSGMVIRNVISKEPNNPEKVQMQNMDKDRRPPRPPSVRSLSKDRVPISTDGDRNIEDKVSGNNDMNFFVASDKQDKRFRTKERHDRGVWAPLHRSDGSHTSDNSNFSRNAQALVEPMENASIIRQSSNSSKSLEDETGLRNSRAGRGAAFHDNSPVYSEMKADYPGYMKIGEGRTTGGRGGLPIIENGVHRHGGRRGVKEAEGPGSLSETKHSKRTVVGYGSNEKQKWVQKPGSG